MKKYLERLLGNGSRGIELNGQRFVEIATKRPTPIFLTKTLWLDYVEPLKNHKGMQEIQLGSMLNEFDYAAFQWKQNPSEDTLYFHAHLLLPFYLEMCFVALRADVWEFEPRQSGIFLYELPSYAAAKHKVNVGSLEVTKSE